MSSQPGSKAPVTPQPLFASYLHRPPSPLSLLAPCLFLPMFVSWLHDLALELEVMNKGPVNDHCLFYLGEEIKDKLIEISSIAKQCFQILNNLPLSSFKPKMHHFSKLHAWRKFLIKSVFVKIKTALSWESLYHHESQNMCVRLRIPLLHQTCREYFWPPRLKKLGQLKISRQINSILLVKVIDGKREKSDTVNG